MECTWSNGSWALLTCGSGINYYYNNTLTTLHQSCHAHWPLFKTHRLFPGDLSALVRQSVCINHPLATGACGRNLAFSTRVDCSSVRVDKQSTTARNKVPYFRDGLPRGVFKWESFEKGNCWGGGGGVFLSGNHSRRGIVEEGGIFKWESFEKGNCWGGGLFFCLSETYKLFTPQVAKFSCGLQRPLCGQPQVV